MQPLDADTRHNVRTLTGLLRRWGYGAHNVLLKKDGNNHLSYGLASSAISHANLRSFRDFCNGSWLLSGSFDPWVRFSETEKLTWEAREESGTSVRLSLCWAGFIGQINMTHLRMRLNKEILDKLF